MPFKIVLVGGSGFLGRYICRALVAAGHEVVVLGRNPAKMERIPQLRGAETVRGDVTDPASLRGVLDGADAVATAVGFPNYPVELPRKGLTFDRYEREATAHLLEEASRASVARYFYLSGVNVDPLSDKNWYRAKGRAEELIRSSGIDYSILRPSWAYGPEDRALNRFRTIARFSPIVPKPGVKVQRIPPVYVEDIALAAARIFERQDAWGRVFEIGGPQVMTMDDVIRTLLRVMGKKRLIVPVPAPLLKLATAPLVVLPRPPLSPGAVDFAVQDGVADTTELKRVLEMEPISLEDGLRRYIR